MAIRSAMARRTLAAAGVVAVLATAASEPKGTAVAKMSLYDVTKNADFIAIGVVASVRPDRDGPEHGMPFRIVTLTDVEHVAGADPGSEIALRFAGGSDSDGIETDIPGMPRFTEREKVMIFAAPSQGAWCPLVGWWQGLYRIADHTDGAGEGVFNHAMTPVVRISGQAEAAEAETAKGGRPMTLQKFRGEVLALR